MYFVIFTALLRAIAQKLIPGMSYSNRVAILQQTSTSTSMVETPPTTPGPSEPKASSVEETAGDRASLPPLQRVLTADTARNTILHEYSQLSLAIDTPTGTDPLAPIRALRQIHLSRLRQQLVEVEKNARLRSGARGSQARKELLAFEKRVQEAEAQGSQPDGEIDVHTIEIETREALRLWTELQSQISLQGSAADAEKRAITILTGLGFTAEKTRKEKRFRDLSGGWQMRCLLAETLFQDSADTMILDEPTNYLDLLGIVWLQRWLYGADADEPASHSSYHDDNTAVRGGMRRQGKVVLIVSHDRDFVDTTCQETIVLRDKNLVSFKGPPSAYDATLRLRIAHMTRLKEAQDRQTRAAEKSITSNMRDAKAKGNDNQIRAAKSRQKRLEERSGLQVSSTTGGRFKLNRDRGGYHDSLRNEIVVPTLEEGGRGLLLPEASELRFPGSLVSLEGVGWRYKSKAPKGSSSVMVLQGVDLVVHMGDRIGIVGLNGCGKTTLVKLITEVGRKPTEGSVTRHAQLKMGYYSQHAVEGLQAIQDPSLTALSLMMREVEDGLSEGEVRGLLGSLGLRGRIASDVPISKLSGGQLVRLALARIIWNSPNLLVLDEITVHLDHYTVAALIDALKDYEGALLLVSHDRFLIRCVVEGRGMGEDDEDEKEDVEDDSRRKIVYLLKGGELKPLEGGVEDFERSLEKRLKKLAL